MMKKVHIIGAGISGLVTAYELLKKGVCVFLYEKENKVGGLSRSLEFDGFYVDLGPHLYHSFNKKIIAYWEALFADLFLKKQYYCKILKRGRLYDYPIARTTISSLPEEIRQKALHELEGLKPQEKAEARTYREYTKSFVGQTLQQFFFEDYPRKLWGMETTELLPNWAPKRIEFREKYEAFYYNQWCGVGKKGSGTITDRLAGLAIKLGGRIECGCELEGIGLAGNRIASLGFKDGKSAAVEEGDIVISTIPINRLCGIMGIESDLKFRSVIFLYAKLDTDLFYRQDHDWLYFSDPEILFHRVTEQKRFSKEGLPAETTVICFEIACDKADSIYRMSDSALAEEALLQLNGLGIGRDLRLLSYKAVRVDELYPKYVKNFEARLAKVKSELSRVANMYNSGSLAEFAYQDIQILFAKAIDLAELVANRYSEVSQNLRTQYEFSFNKEVKIGSRTIGEGQRPYVIAEAGLNHNGSVKIAKDLITEAKKAGCDAVKFQTFRADDRVSNAVRHAEYFEKTLDMEENYYQMFKRLELSNDEFAEIFAYGRGLGIEVFSTPFAEKDVDLLEELGVNCFKISSFDLVNLKLLKYAASKKKPMILSTGMANLGLIEEALEAIASAGNKDVALLHCVSNYPADPEDLNLSAIKALKAAFCVPVGYSDHTIGLLAANLAMSLGAVTIEKHFTLSNDYEGPDHIISSTPEEMRELVSNSHLIPKILGTGHKRITTAEYDTINKFRKSIYARRDIPEGRIISADDLTVKGPGHGLLPRYFDIVVGRPARRPVQADHPLTWEDV